MNEPLILVVLISYCNVSFAGFPDLEENSAMLQVFQVVWQMGWLLIGIFGALSSCVQLMARTVCLGITALS